MRYSQLFGKTQKKSKEYDSVNATLLIKGGFIHQTMAGVYTFLPLGLRVLNKIENIIRAEMDTLGEELLMPALSPKELWETTGRYQTVGILFKAMGANAESVKNNSAEYALNSTHEEIITPIAKKFQLSYRDLPFAVYQIQTKFRNEPRAKSGLLRCREFRMKDLYSFHPNEKSLEEYYEKVKNAYLRIFKNLGIGKDTVIALASGGDFTEKYSHEFQTICDTGEDLIYLDRKSGVYYNQEVAPNAGKQNQDVKIEYEVMRACEVGNIFPLNTKFTQPFEYAYTDEKGKKRPVYMGSYGIGSSRIMGVIAEKFHDDKGILWPKEVAPYCIHLMVIGKNEKLQKIAENLFGILQKESIEVLFDDRPDITPGEKFADADLIGIPFRAVISEKTKNKVELKIRSENKLELVSPSTLMGVCRKK